MKGEIKQKQHKEAFQMCEHTTDEFLRAAGMDDAADELLEAIEDEAIEGVAVI